MFNRWISIFLFFVLGLSVVGILNLNKTLVTLEEKVEIIAFLQQGMANDLLNNLKDHIAKLDNVSQIIYVSPEKALAEFTQDEIIRQQIKIVGENPLPGYFIIKARDKTVQELKKLVASVSKLEGIEEVKYGEEEAQNLRQTTETIKFLIKISGAILWLLVFMMLFYVFWSDVLKALSLSPSRLSFLFFLKDTIISLSIGVVGSISGLFLLYKIISKDIPGMVFLAPINMLYLILAELILGILVTSLVYIFYLKMPVSVLQLSQVKKEGTSIEGAGEDTSPKLSNGEKGNSSS